MTTVTSCGHVEPWDECNSTSVANGHAPSVNSYSSFSGLYVSPRHLFSFISLVEFVGVFLVTVFGKKTERHGK